VTFWLSGLWVRIFRCSRGCLATVEDPNALFLHMSVRVTFFPSSMAARAGELNNSVSLLGDPYSIILW
jgi:hypothetical protein